MVGRRSRLMTTEFINFAEFIDLKWEWSKETFGPGRRTAGISDHIRRELKEIAEDPEELDEWVDIILLAIDGACRAGHKGEKIVAGILSKHMKNVGRDWPDWRTMSEDEAIEHVRDK
jgi:dATP/dGTP diphosphohydrolase